MEVPEIAEGIVKIKGIAREAGDRTKVAVTSTDEKIDCVGACVGMRGTRVKNIVRELHGEKVDIIRWHKDVKEYIAFALSPAKVSEIQEHADTKQALVIVDDDQLSLAIGKKGQNVRLASKLVGWQLEIKSRGQLTTGEMSLETLPGVGPTLKQRLAEAGVVTVQQLAAMTLEQLCGIKGIGEKTAQKVLESVQRALTTKGGDDAAAQAPAEPTAGDTTKPAEEASASPVEDSAQEGASDVSVSTGEGPSETHKPSPEPGDANDANESTSEEVEG